MRAQSTVSATDGTLRRSIARSAPTTRTRGLGEHRVELRASGRRSGAQLLVGSDVNGQRRRSADSSRLAFEVSTTNGRRVALIVPSSGTVTWKSESTSEQALHLHVGLVHLVDEQDLRVVAADRGQQGPRQQELLAEDVRARLVPRRRRGPP